MSIFSIANEILNNHYSVVVSLQNPILDFKRSMSDLSTIRKENALMRMYLHIDTDKIETEEEWARLNCEMWYALKITGKVQKNKNGKLYFSQNG
jgi:hypothetical protein